MDVAASEHGTPGMIRDLRPKRFVSEGEVFGPGGPLYCAKHRPREPGRRCGGFVGMPSLGSLLIHVLEPGEFVGEAHPELAAFQCSRCRRHYVFRYLKAA
jgi:hypothetical protein